MLSIVIYCSMNGLRGIAAKCVMLVLPYYVNVGYVKETKNSFLPSFITYFSRIFVFLRVSSKVATASWLGNDALNIEDRILCKIFLFLSLWRVSLWPCFSTLSRGGGICDLSSLGGLSDDLFTWDLKKKCKIKNGSRRKPGKRFSNHCQVMLMYFPSAGQRSGAHDIKGQGTRGNELLATLLHVPVATANHTIAWPGGKCMQHHVVSTGQEIFALFLFETFWGYVFGDDPPGHPWLLLMFLWPSWRVVASRHRLRQLPAQPLTSSSGHWRQRRWYLNHVYIGRHLVLFIVLWEGGV